MGRSPGGLRIFFPGRVVRAAAHGQPEPGPGVGPVLVGGGRGDPEDLGGLPDGQPGEEPELDEFGLPGVLPGELLERVVQCEQVEVGPPDRRPDVGEVEPAPVPAGLQAPLAAGLLDREQASEEELASLYRARWNNELDLRSIKVTLQMDMLRCKTPELVRKEIWAHVLAYNLIRTVMAQAAAREDVPPRSISFKAAPQVLEAFRPLIDYRAGRGEAHRAALDQQVLRAIAVHRVADRPDRFEPRMAKRRPERYDRLTRPRREIKLRMPKGVSKI